jgi:hypothetical protein
VFSFLFFRGDTGGGESCGYEIASSSNRRGDGGSQEVVIEETDPMEDAVDGRVGVRRGRCRGGWTSMIAAELVFDDRREEFLLLTPTATELASLTTCNPLRDSSGCVNILSGCLKLEWRMVFAWNSLDGQAEFELASGKEGEVGVEDIVDEIVSDDGLGSRVTASRAGVTTLVC